MLARMKGCRSQALRRAISSFRTQDCSAARQGWDDNGRRKAGRGLLGEGRLLLKRPRKKLVKRLHKIDRNVLGEKRMGSERAVMRRHAPTRAMFLTFGC